MMKRMLMRKKPGLKQTVIKLPDEFQVTVRKTDRKNKPWVATSVEGSGFGDTAREALCNLAEGMEVGLNINQRFALYDFDADTQN